MSAIHRIRLRGSWTVTALETPAGQPLPESVSMTCPCSWRAGGWLNFRGRARCARRFGNPTNIDPRERVWLVIDPCEGDITIAMNGVDIGRSASGSAFERDITDMIAPRNVLQIDVSGTDDNAGLTGEVRLEIRSSD
jgi:hypothetical protein